MIMIMTRRLLFWFETEQLHCCTLQANMHAQYKNHFVVSPLKEEEEVYGLVELVRAWWMEQ